MEWRPIPDWPEYEISEAGAVRRTTILKQFTSKQNCYPQLSLTHHHHQRSFTVHSLVALAFLGPPPKRLGIERQAMQINHKDGNKQNNHWTNLEYIPREENMRHAGLMKLTESEVRIIRALRAAGHPLKILAAKFGVSKATVCDICKRRGWAHL